MRYVAFLWAEKSTLQLIVKRCKSFFLPSPPSILDTPAAGRVWWDIKFYLARALLRRIALVLKHGIRGFGKEGRRRGRAVDEPTA
jgi:hypothetical protein